MGKYYFVSGGFQPMNIAPVSKQIDMNILREAAYLQVHIQLPCLNCCFDLICFKKLFVQVCAIPELLSSSQS